MKQEKTKQTLLILGLFVALGMNVSSLQDGTVQVAAMEEGEIFLSSSGDTIDKRGKIHRGGEEYLLDEYGKDKTGEIKVKLANGESATVSIRAVEALSETMLPEAQRADKSVSDIKWDDDASTWEFTDKEVDLNTSSDKEVNDAKYKGKTTTELKQMIKDQRDIFNQANREHQDGNTLTGAKTRAKTKGENARKEAEAIQDHINRTRRTAKIEIDGVPEGFWDVCTDNCDTSAFKDSDNQMLNLEDVGDIDLMDMQVLVANIEDMGSVMSAVKKTKKAISDKNKANQKAYRKFKNDIAKRKRCEVDESFEKLPKGKGAKQECWLDLLESIVDGGESWLYEDEKDREKLVKDIYAKIKPSLRKGKLDDRLDKIDDVLDVFEVDVTDGDYDAVFDDDQEPIVANLLIERFNTETIPDIRNAAQVYSRARYYGPENREIVSAMEKVFERNGINNYVHSRYVDSYNRRSAQILSRSAIDMYCGAKTNMNPNYNAALYDWNCAQANRGGFTSGQQILNQVGSLGYDSGSNFDNYDMFSGDPRYDFDRGLTNNFRQPLDGNRFAGRDFDQRRRFGRDRYSMDGGTDFRFDSRNFSNNRGNYRSNGRFDMRFDSRQNYRGQQYGQNYDPRYGGQYSQQNRYGNNNPYQSGRYGNYNMPGQQQFDNRRAGTRPRSNGVTSRRGRL